MRSDSSVTASVFSVDGLSASFNPKLPHRGLGKFMCFASLLGVFLIFCSVMMATDGKHKDKPEVPSFFIFGVVATLAFLLPGLYLATRRVNVKIDKSGVYSMTGWCLHKKHIHRPLSEYAGLLRDSKQVGSYDAGSAATTVAGVAATAILGAGVISMGKYTVLHILRLKHSHDGGSDVTLACSPDQQAIIELMETMAVRFSLDILDPTLNGYEVRRPEDLGKSLSERNLQPAASGTTDEIQLQPGGGMFTADSSSAVLPNPPAGLQCDDAGGSLAVLVPNDRAPLAIGIIMGSCFLAVALLSLLAMDDTWSNSSKGGVALGAGLGVIMLLVGIFNATRRWKLTIDRQGVCVTGWGASAVPRLFEWDTIESVTAARMRPGNKRALLLVTSHGDRWLFPGAKAAWLDWIRRAIIHHAQRHKGG